MSTSILSDISLDEFVDVIDDASLFTPSGRSVTLREGTKAPMLATFAGQEFEGWAQLHHARLARVSLLQHSVRSDGDRQSWLVSGVFRPVRMDLYIADGEEEIHIVEVLRRMTNESRKRRGLDELSFAVFNTRLFRSSLPLYPDPERGNQGHMPMFWQHFGANSDEVDRIMQYMLDLGGTYDNRTPKPGQSNRIKKAVVVDPGIPVTTIEVGRQDRSRNQHAGKIVAGTNSIFEGQGFLNFYDAVYGNYVRALTLKTSISEMKAQRDELAAKDAKANSKKIDELNARIQVTTQMSRQFMNNWGGAQQRVLEQPGDTITFEDIFDAVSVPVGSFTLQPEVTQPDGDVTRGAEEQFNFWINQNQSSDSSTDANSTNEVIDATDGLLTDGQKF